MTNNKLYKYNFTIVAIIFRIILDISYFRLFKIDNPIEYSLDINFIKLLFSYIIIIIISYKTFYYNKTSVFFFRIIIFFTIIPISTVYCMRNENTMFFLLTNISFYLAEIVFFRFRVPKKCSRFNILPDNNLYTTVNNINIHNRKINIMSQILNFLFIFITLVAILMMFEQNGFPNLSTIILSNVYTVRRDYEMTKYLSYLVSIITVVIVPFGIAEGMVHNKKLQMFFYFLVQFCLFLWTGHKTWLFSVFLLGFIIFIYSKRLSLNIFFTSVSLFAMVGCIFSNSNSFLRYLFSLLNRRVLLDPAALKFFYYDYFIVQNNPKLYFSGTVIAPFLPSFMIDKSIFNYPYIISEQYTGIKSNAGTGLYGGDVANLGFYAFLVVPFLLVILLSLIERSNYRNGSKFTVLSFIYIIYAFNDQRIFLYFFDYSGLLMVFIMLFLKLKVNNNYVIKNSYIDSKKIK